MLYWCLQCLLISDVLMSSRSIWRHFLKNENNVDCHWSSWLNWFSKICPAFLCLKDSIPSRYFRWVHDFSFAMILARSQSTPFGHTVACFASPPSLSFIRLFALSACPCSISSFVNLTLLWCSFFLLSWFPISDLFHRHNCTYRTYTVCDTPRSCSCRQEVSLLSISMSISISMSTSITNIIKGTFPHFFLFLI